MATSSGNEHMTGAIHLQSLNISNTNYSSDTQSGVEIMTLPEKETDSGTATIGDKCTFDNMVVCGKSFETITAAVDEKYETLVHSSNLNELKERHKLSANNTPIDSVRPHVCDICGLAFKKIYTLTVHYRMHTGHKPFACNVCGDTFTCSANRSVHMRTHTGYRPYVCDLCGFTFNQSHVLTEHKRLHTGERPYECGLCKLAFVSSGLLRKHTIRKHNNKI